MDVTYFIQTLVAALAHQAEVPNKLGNYTNRGGRTQNDTILPLLPSGVKVLAIDVWVSRLMVTNLTA